VCRKRTSLLLTLKAFLKALVGTLIEHLLERFGPFFLSTLEIKGTIVRVGGFVLTGTFCVPTSMAESNGQRDLAERIHEAGQRNLAERLEEMEQHGTPLE
jgi:hypothetical protein